MIGVRGVLDFLVRDKESGIKMFLPSKSIEIEEFINKRRKPRFKL